MSNDKKPFDKEAWVAKTKEIREDLYGKIDAMTQDMAHDVGLFQTYLDVQAKFDRYSVGNALLVAIQKPDAVQLKSFDDWKEAKAHILKGQRAIYILEPGNEYKREDGSVGVYYNPKKVFDVSQTNAEPPARTAEHDNRQLMTALVQTASCTFGAVDFLPDGAKSAYDAQTNTVQVLKGLDSNVSLGECIRQIALLSLEQNGAESAMPEFAAAGAAYLVAKRHGIPTTLPADKGMPEQWQEMDSRSVRHELEVMRKVAGDISADMNRYFEKQENVRDEGAR